MFLNPEENVRCSLKQTPQLFVAVLFFFFCFVSDDVVHFVSDDVVHFVSDDVVHFCFVLDTNGRERETA